MSNYQNTKATIAANVYTNHNNEVTAEMVKTGINAVVDTLIAGGFLYKGVATTSTNPGSPDANVFYIATAPGTYTNFGSLVVADGEVAILKYNGSWSKEVTGAATAAEVTALGHEVNEEVQIGLYEPQYNQPVLYELGGITMNNGGWSYTSTNDRVRTPQNYILHLYPGDVVGLSDYTDARFTLGISDGLGNFRNTGWLTADYTMVDEGYCCLLVSNLNYTAQSSADALGSLIRIQRNNTDTDFRDAISAVENTIGDDIDKVLLYGSDFFYTWYWDSGNSKFAGNSSWRTILIPLSPGRKYKIGTISGLNNTRIFATKPIYNTAITPTSTAEQTFTGGGTRNWLAVTISNSQWSAGADKTFDLTMYAGGIKSTLSPLPDEIKYNADSNLALYHLTGADSTIVGRYVNLIGGHRYRLDLPKAWSYANVGSNVKVIGVSHWINNVESQDIVVLSNSYDGTNHYEFTAVNADYYRFFFRGDSGQDIIFGITDITFGKITAENGADYIGAPIRLNRFAVERNFALGASPTTSTRQGVAYYDGILFQFHNTNDYVEVYDANAKSKVYEIDLTQTSLYNANYHCNNANFGTQKYDVDDRFPALYVSMENAAEHKVLVLRVQESAGVYSMTLVQTLTLPVPSSASLYYPNAYIDNDNGVIWASGYSTNSYSAGGGNKLKYVKFNLPLLSAGDVTFSASDILETAEFDAITATQGGIIHNHLLYQVFGITSQDYYLKVFDLYDDKILSSVPLYQLLDYEPEGIFIKDGELFYTWNDYVMRLIF